MRYNIALLATVPNLYIQEAQKLFASTAQGYLLSLSSLPHITLAQFYADNNQLAEIWYDVQSRVFSMPQPQFIGIGFTKKSKNLWGASLTVVRSLELVTCHRTIVEILEHHAIPCINDVGELYRPHLTLARIAEPKLMNFNDALLEDNSFILALGQTDENGQYLHTIYK